MTSTYLQELMNNENPEYNANVILCSWLQDCYKPNFNFNFYPKAFEIIFLKAQGGYLPPKFFSKLIRAINRYPDDRFSPLLSDMHHCLHTSGFTQEFNKVLSLEQRIRNEREGMPNKARKFTHDEIEDAIFAADGNVALIAEALGVSRPTIYYHIEKNPHLYDALWAARDAASEGVS